METHSGKASSEDRGESRGGNAERYSPVSELYLLRLWVGLDEAGQNEWHGKLQHVVNGRAHHFHGWYSLVDLLTALLPNADTFTPLKDRLQERSDPGESKPPGR